VTSNAALEVESYRFKTLADATGEQPAFSRDKEEEEGGGAAHKSGGSRGIRILTPCNYKDKQLDR